MTDPYQQCENCGLPQRVITALLAKKVPMPMHFSIWTLTADHIVPRAQGGANERANIRVLCWLCNTRRGNNARSDAAVLQWVRREWYKLHSHRDLWWLNTKPGEGGRAYRGKKHPEWVLDMPQENAGFREAYLDSLRGLPL